MDGLKDVHLAWEGGYGTSPSDCMSQSTYNAILDSGGTVGNLYVCELGYVGNPVTIWGSGSGTSYDPWGSGNVGTGSGSGHTSNTSGYCKWCIWESCFHKAAGLASGSGSGWISNDPLGSGDTYNLETILTSYGFAESSSRNKVSSSIVVPKIYSPRDANDYPKITQLRIRCCSRNSAGTSFRIGLQRDSESSVNERSLYGPGYAETTFPFSMSYNAIARAKVYFSTDDPAGGLFSWELLP